MRYLELKAQMLIAIKTALQIEIPKRNHLENMHFILEQDWPTSRIHIEKRDQAYFTARRMGFLDRKHKTIIIDSDSDQNCTGISIKMRKLELKVQMLIAMNT
jgi:hypothetical protein